MTTEQPKFFFDPLIEHGVPLPAEPKRKARARTQGAQIRWPFAQMNVGDSVLIPEWAEPTRATAYVIKARREKQLPATYKITVRKTDEGFRAWRIA